MDDGPYLFAQWWNSLGYQVFYKKTGQRYRQDWLKAVSFSTIETDIEGLEKYTIYTFRIVVFTKNGNGVASQPVTVSTDEDSKLN